ncbi:hypothetical protein NVP1215B_057 [Vibrio phage 1.215.B._10N.222.54.F7]|nr:hypothetical protein NVP1215A_057 [Vibrio phage 1.215.A._10N.222.54.F7]AUR96080.1 hypothetical protein NVP1215B_057 [Vibrio phage 1.215.B._10N.222.54.F7]
MTNAFVTSSQINRTVKTLSKIEDYAVDSALPEAYLNTVKEVRAIVNALTKEPSGSNAAIFLDAAIDKCNAFGCLVAHRNLTGDNARLTEQRKHELEAVYNMLEAVRVYLTTLIKQ